MFWNTFHLPDFPSTLLAILADHATRFLVLPHSYSHFLLMRDAPWELVSCDEDVGEVGEDELEELVDRPETANGA